MASKNSLLCARRTWPLVRNAPTGGYHSTVARGLPRVEYLRCGSPPSRGWGRASAARAHRKGGLAAAACGGGRHCPGRELTLTDPLRRTDIGWSARARACCSASTGEPEAAHGP